MNTRPTLPLRPAPLEPMPADEDRQPLSYADLRRLVVFILTMGLAGALVRELASTLLLFAVVFLLAIILNPLVVWLQKRGIKRGLAVVLVLLSLILVLGGLLAIAVPPLLAEANQFVKKAPTYGANIRDQLHGLGERYPALGRVLPDTGNLAQQAANQASRLPAAVLQRSFGLLGGVFVSVIGGIFLSVLALLVLVFTLSTPQPLIAGFLSAVPERHRPAAARSFERMMQQMAAWIKATLINGAITGLSIGILLHFIGVQPALVFGTLAFLGEFVPNLGPVVAAIPALFVAIGMGPTTALQTAAAILFVQQVESNLLVPFIMGRQMQLHPVTIVFFALAMGSLMGITGAILAVPAAALAKILFDEFYLKPRRVPVQEIEAQAATLVGGPDEAPKNEDNEDKADDETPPNPAS